MAGITGSTNDNASNGLALLKAAQAPTVNTPTVVSGTAQQDPSGLPSDVYVQITGGASGTVKVDIGASNAVSTPLIPNGDATLSRCTHFRLPAGWFFRVTVGGSASIASAVQVIGG